jgi:hypothetical protein
LTVPPRLVLHVRHVTFSATCCRGTTADALPFRAPRARLALVSREAPYPDPHESEAFVRRSVLETRGLHALPREKEIDCLAVHAQHTSDAHCVETAIVDQATNGFRVDAELVRDITHADEVRLLIRRRHATSQTYSRNCWIASPSSRDDTAPSNFALILPSRPTRNVQGSPGKCHSRTQRFGPLLGLLPA